MTDQTEILRQRIEEVMAHYSLPLRAARMYDVLGHLRAWVIHVDHRLDLIEASRRREELHYGKLELQLLALVNTARKEGMLDAVIRDAERPGGALPGDQPL